MEAFAVSLSACFPKFPHRLSAPHPSPPPPSGEVRRGAGERSEILHLLRETARAEERERELLSQWPNVHFTPHPHPEDLDMYLGTDDADNVKKFYCCEEWG